MSNKTNEVLLKFKMAATDKHKFFGRAQKFFFLKFQHDILSNKGMFK